ncbi:uncharacterized protein LOC118262841 isoform X1 [Spodoptera frugiperda]|uniref:Uncharacterized protein LOC118262841 isoform X1 n=2 Tax=Spodoptera frugiperda TaxID=7108 RepID=A0A9R0CVA7_SPOFR|nr:uncharacterized protein LOC118262841 isoform X1 [Spodoptera frugiperda]
MRLVGDKVVIMVSKIILIFIAKILWTVAWDMSDVDDIDDIDIYEINTGKAPFFELPCMKIGGTCAKVHACPPGTKVGQKGLCPEQQKYGMECCRPRHKAVAVSSGSSTGRQHIPVKWTINKEDKGKSWKKKVQPKLLWRTKSKGLTECRSRHGECVPRSFRCSPDLHVSDATGCGFKETCCLRIPLHAM